MKTLITKYRKIIIIVILLVFVLLSTSFVIVDLLQNLNYHPLLVVLVEMTILLLCILGLVYVGIKKNIITFSKRLYWSIGIYVGQNPYKFHPAENVKNPVLTAANVTDLKADFVADPFMVKENSTWYMFFEVLNSLTGHGNIGLAVSEDGYSWDYKQVILKEPFHLSYPYVFEWQKKYYMIPECATANSIRLYEAEEFPYHWSFVGALLEGKQYSDTSIIRFKNKWWIFTCPEPEKHDTLLLFYADELTGPWMHHPKSPIVKCNAKIARSGGRFLVFKDRIIRYAQDCVPTYGRNVLAFEITRLTQTDYQERDISANPILKANGSGWNTHGMHHIDPHRLDNGMWIACVDGYRKYLTIQIEY